MIGLVNSAVASYYYLRLIVVMYMREPMVDQPPARASMATRLALVLAAIATVYMGVVPGRVLDYASVAAVTLQPAAKASGAKTGMITVFRFIPPPNAQPPASTK